MIDELDLKKLNTMTAFLKAESEYTSQFTIGFIECLIYRYNLDTALFDGIEIEGFPDELISMIQRGEVPSQDDLLSLDSNEQNNFIITLVWYAGLQRIKEFSSYDEQQEDGVPSFVDQFLVMGDISSAHRAGSYLMAALTLLMACIPSPDFMDAITNNFEDSPYNVKRITGMFVEICGSLYQRYYEDNHYYGIEQEDEQQV